MQILGILKLPCAAVSMFLPIPSANQILFSTIYISPPNQEPQEYCQHLGLRSRSIAHPHLPRNSSVALNFSPYSKEGTKSDTKIKQATTQLHSGLGLGPLMHLCKPLKHHILHQSFSACWAWHWSSSIWLSFSSYWSFSERLHCIIIAHLLQDQFVNQRASKVLFYLLSFTSLSFLIFFILKILKLNCFKKDYVYFKHVLHG